MLACLLPFNIFQGFSPRALSPCKLIQSSFQSLLSSRLLSIASSRLLALVDLFLQRSKLIRITRKISSFWKETFGKRARLRFWTFSNFLYLICRSEEGKTMSLGAPCEDAFRHRFLLFFFSWQIKYIFKNQISNSSNQSSCRKLGLFHERKWAIYFPPEANKVNGIS